MCVCVFVGAGCQDGRGGEIVARVTAWEGRVERRVEPGKAEMNEGVIVMAKVGWWDGEGCGGGVGGVGKGVWWGFQELAANIYTYVG